jgi:hypothetical protein
VIVQDSDLRTMCLEPRFSATKNRFYVPKRDPHKDNLVGALVGILLKESKVLHQSARKPTGGF